MVKKEEKKPKKRLKVVSSKGTGAKRGRPAKNTVTEEQQVDIEKKIEFKELEGAFMLVRVGSQSKPSSDEEIQQVTSTLLQLIEGNDVNCMIYICHHDIDIKIIR